MAAWANLPAVASPDILKLTLGSEIPALGGLPEIVYVTAHTASSQTITITRGREGTTARAHNASTLESWRHAETAAEVTALGLGIVNVTDPIFGGAISGDWTVAIRNAAAASLAATAGVGNVVFPPGTYQMGTVDAAGLMVALTRGVRFSAAIPGTVTIQLVSSCPDFYAMFGSTAAASRPDLSGLWFDGLTFDYGTNSITAGNVATLIASRPRLIASAYKGSHFGATNNKIIGWDSINCFVCDGQFEDVSDVTFVGNTATGVCPSTGTAFHDHSTFYCDAIGVQCYANHCTAADVTYSSAQTAYELHGSDIHEHDNYAKNYYNGAYILTGIMLRSAIHSSMNGLTLPRTPITLTAIPAGLPTSGVVGIYGKGVVAYTGISGNDLTGCTGGTGALATGETVYSSVARSGGGTGNLGYHSHNSVWENVGFGVSPGAFIAGSSDWHIHDHSIVIDINRWDESPFAPGVDVAHMGINFLGYWSISNVRIHDIDVTFKSGYSVANASASDIGVGVTHTWDPEADDYDIHIHDIKVRNAPGTAVTIGMQSASRNIHVLKVNRITSINGGRKAANAYQSSAVFINAVNLLEDAEVNDLTVIDTQGTHTVTTPLYVSVVSAVPDIRSFNQSVRLADAATIPSYTIFGGNVILTDVEDFAFDPAWTSTGTAPALGNGQISGRFTQSNGIVSASIELIMGSTTTYGTGIYHLGLPRATNFAGPNNAPQLGNGYIFDSSAGLFYPFTVFAARGDAFVQLIVAAGLVTNTVPVTLANGDVIRLTLNYRA